MKTKDRKRIKDFVYLASRIHISWSCRDNLIKANEGFFIQERGKVELKGKGELFTYWLTGKENVHKIKNQYFNQDLTFFTKCLFNFKIWCTNNQKFWCNKYSCKTNQKFLV